MSDTSGRVNFGSAGRKIRRQVTSKTKPLALKQGTATMAMGSVTTAPPQEPNTQAGAGPSFAVVTETVWKILESEGLLRKAFLSPDLVALLKRMAIFIEIAANPSEGMDDVMKQFDVQKTSAFGWLQRRIRETAEVNEPTDFAGPAKRAFQVGSNEWAVKLLGKTDPTKFNVRDVVDAVRRSPDEALVLSPDRILLDYGKRVIAAAIGGAQVNADLAAAGASGFEHQHREFMNRNNEASHWGSKVMRSTVKTYITELLGA